MTNRLFQRISEGLVDFQDIPFWLQGENRMKWIDAERRRVVAEVARYHEAFNVYDPDWTQTICDADVGYLLAALGEDPTEVDLETMHQVLPGMITFPDFAVWMWRYVGVGAPRLQPSSASRMQSD